LKFDYFIVDMNDARQQGQNEPEQPVFSAHDFLNRSACRLSLPRLPQFCILGFFPSIGAHVKRAYASTVFSQIHPGHPYHVFTHRGTAMSYQLCGIGAPAAALLLEECIDLGASQFVVLGTAGVLDETIPAGSILLVDSALSDEGTSRHYRPGQRAADADSGLLRRVRMQLDSLGIVYRPGKTWSTDAPFRETPGKVLHAIQEGCAFVDMELSALYTISEYYQKKITGIFIATDAVTEKKWIPRKIPKTNDGITPVKLFDIITDMGSRIQEQGNAV
jgi:uridine phosphorylase